MGIITALGLLLVTVGFVKREWEELVDKNNDAREAGDDNRDAQRLLEETLRGSISTLQLAGTGWRLFAEDLVDGINDVREGNDFLSQHIDDAWTRLKEASSGTIALVQALGRVSEDVYQNIIVPALDAVETNIRDLISVSKGFASDVAVIGAQVRDDFWSIVHAVDALIDRIQSLIDWIGKIPSPGDILPDLPGGGIIGKAIDLIPDPLKIGDLNPFAMGTPYVPRDMLAVVHRGEAIIPASQNGRASQTGGGVNVQIDIANVEGNVDHGAILRLERLLGARLEQAMFADSFGGMAVNTAPFAM
jgi:hypothetical protein